MAVHCKGDIEFASDETLKWYQSSEMAERGFCANCGTSLFYRYQKHPDAFMIVAVDTLEGRDAFKLGQHIYVDQQPASYAFADDRPKLTKEEFLAAIRQR